MTKEYLIQADVHAIWIKIPIYRVWINGELMCERTYWPNPEKLYIQENMIVELSPGTHKVELEQVDPTLGKIWIDKIIVTDIEIDSGQQVTPGIIDYAKVQEITFSV